MSGDFAARTVAPTVPRARVPAAHVLALVVAVVASVLMVAYLPRHGPTSVIAVIGATAGCGAVAILERRTPRLGSGLIATAIFVVMVVAVATPPRTSNDLWSYGAYGRIVATHDADPYQVTPSDYPADPFAQRVSRIWLHRPSVYGPVWMGVATVDAAIVGTSTLANRLFFQLLAAIAAAAVLLIVWRRTRSTAALAWLGLHPVLAIAVNGGHVDLLIGLAVLGSVLLAMRGRAIAAGVVIGAAVLIKITALLAVAGVALWAWHTQRRRLAALFTASTGATVLIGYAPFLGVAHVLASADHTVTPASPWNGLTDLLLGRDAWRQVAHPLAFNQTLDVVFYGGVVLVGALALVLGWRASQTGDAKRTTGVTTAAYTFGAAYSMPWYANLALPLFAEASPDPLAWIVWLQAALLLIDLKMRDHSTGTLGDALLRGLFTDTLPLALLIGFVVVGWRGGRVRGPRRDAGPASSSADQGARVDEEPER